MSNQNPPEENQKWPTLALLPLPGKVLATVIILTMAVALGGAAGQVIVHDIIPTFFSGQQPDHPDNLASSDARASRADDQASSSRGDLLAETPVQTEVTEKQPVYQTEQFVWTLKWTHIHLFGMSMIFIFMGAITLFLNISIRARTWLIILPFLGVWVDIATVWLKGYAAPAFFWLHVFGGGLFGIVFVIVSVRSFWEMFWMKSRA